MADTTTDSDLMEVEDSSDSIQIEKNGVSDEDGETTPKLAKTPSDSAEPMEDDSLSNSIHDIEGEDSLINESDNKEDTNDNASDSLEVPTVEPADTTAVEPEDLNGDVSLVEPPDTTAEESIDTNGDVSLVDKDCEDNNIDDNMDNNAIDNDTIDNDNNIDIDNNIDNEAAPAEAEITVSSVLSEKRLDSETDSPKPSVLKEILTEASSKNSPEIIISNSSPSVKDKFEANDNAKVVKEKKNDEKVDSTENIEEMDCKEKESETEPKEKSKSSKKKKAKACANCGSKKKLPLRIVFQGKFRHLCSETCFKNFKEKNMTKLSGPRLVNENCAECQTKIENKPGFFPSVGEVKPLCSEECVIKYQEKHSTPIYCGQCKERVQSAYNRLTWETMVFCNDTCLVKYQTDLGSHCTSCHSPVQKTSLGKYCVCFGSDIRQFCSGSCLEEFKKGLKICSFCQNDLSTGGEGFLAPVGDKGQFKDFCSPICMERYEVVNNIAKVVPEPKECYSCKNLGIYKIQVKHGDTTYPLCSDMCLSVFRCTFQIVDNICRNCFQHFKPNEGEVFSFIFEGFPKHFCAKTCMTLFVLSNRKIINCLNCKVKKYNFDMIEKLDSNNQFQMFCSSYCLNTFRVHYSANPPQKINCDGCNKSSSIQFHLTMSDGSMRNFCTYECVTAFQRDKHGMQLPFNSHGVNTTTSNNSPIIANVMSLAQPSRSGLSPQSQSRPRLPQHPLMPQSFGPTANSMPPPKILSPSPSVSSSSTLTISQSNAGGIMKEVIVRPPPPKSLRNKSASCRPIMVTKGVSVKSQTCNKAVQTDDTRLPSILPVPFPVYLPSPVIMYTKTISVPMPFPVPVPIPVPVFINKEKPCTRPHISDVSNMETEPIANLETKSAKSVETNSTESLKEKSTESLETKSTESLEIKSIESLEINTAESTETNSAESLEVSNHKISDPSPQVCSTTVVGNSVPAPPETIDISSDVSKEVESIPQASAASENSSHQVIERTTNLQDSELAANPVLAPKIEPIDEDIPTEFKPRRKKRSGEDLIVTEGKKAKTDEDYIEYMYGVNAWKQWVALKNGLMERGSSRKFKSFKTDLLLLSPSELGYSLSLFVKEVSKPNGQPYSAGTLFYLLLGIQYYMNENGRTDDLFSDEVYSSFAEHFHDVLLQYEGRAMGQEYPNPRIKEVFLWQSKQLGAQSPQILLNTLMYFNAQFFKLRTVAAHMGLNFSHIARHTDEQGSFLRYYKEDNGKKEEENMSEFGRKNHLTQSENKDDIMRCPVRLFEFYVSKCPPSCIENDSKFYCQVAESFSTDNKYWFSDIPLCEKIITENFQRIKLVEEAGIVL